jgi:hypothetical protein
MKKPFTFSCFKIDEALQEGINEYHRLAGNPVNTHANPSPKKDPKKHGTPKLWLINIISFLGVFNK